MCPSGVLCLVTWQVCWCFLCYIFFFFLLQNRAYPPAPHCAVRLTDVSKHFTWKECLGLIPPEKLAGVYVGQRQGFHVTELVLSYHPSEQRHPLLRPVWTMPLPLLLHFQVRVQENRGCLRDFVGKAEQSAAPSLCPLRVTALKPWPLSAPQ